MCFLWVGVQCLGFSGMELSAPPKGVEFRVHILDVVRGLRVQGSHVWGAGCRRCC